MKQVRAVSTLFAFSLLFAFLASCAPGAETVVPQETEELVTQLPFPEAYSTVVNTINTQPYPSNSSGWIITNSDQVGGFVSAQLNVESCSFWGGCTQYTAQVSVALVERPDETAVSISLTRHDEAQDLVERINERLDLS